MMLFDSTLRRDLARSFGATLIVILSIVMTMLLIRSLGQAAVGRVAPQDVLLLLGYVALGYLPTILALSLFVSVVATLGRMYRDSEMTIWFASGVGVARFVRPVLGLAWPVLLVIALLAFIAWPWVNQRTAELRQRFEQRSDLSRVAPGQFQSSSDGRRTFFIERDPADERVGRNVFILIASADAESVTTARAGRIVSEGGERMLHLERGQRNERRTKTGEKTIARFESYVVSVGEAPRGDAGQRVPRARPTAELIGDPTPALQGELAWRIGLALGAFNLVLLGVGLAYGNPRRGGSWNLVFALLAFIVYYNVINLTQSSVAGGRASVAGAVLGAHGSALLLALGLLWWRERAVGRPRLRLRVFRRRAA